jgi:hypothetical protein
MGEGLFGACTESLCLLWGVDLGQADFDGLVLAVRSERIAV